MLATVEETGVEASRVKDETEPARGAETLNYETGGPHGKGGTQCTVEVCTGSAESGPGQRSRGHLGGWDGRGRGPGSPT